MICRQMQTFKYEGHIRPFLKFDANAVVQCEERLKKVHWFENNFCCRKSPEAPKKRVKQATKWNLGGTTKEMKNLDYSGSHGDSAAVNGDSEEPTELEVYYNKNTFQKDAYRRPGVHTPC